MNKLYFLLVAGLFFAHSASAQLAHVTSLTADAPAVGKLASANAPFSPDSIFVAPDVLPQFTGGTEAMKAFLAKNLRYPEIALRQHTTGRVFMRFTVSAEGRISDVTVVRGLGNGISEEATRLMWFMPPWQPGRHHGQAVKTACTLPISFER